MLHRAREDRGYVGCSSPAARSSLDRGGRGGERAKRIPFDPGVDFEERTQAILRWYRNTEDPYRRVLLLLVNCDVSDHGRAYAQQYQGATYRQLASIAHAADMSWEERQEWYAVCESVGLAHRHAAHILGRVTRQSPRKCSPPFENDLTSFSADDADDMGGERM